METKCWIHYIVLLLGATLMMQSAAASGPGEQQGFLAWLREQFELGSQRMAKGLHSWEDAHKSCNELVIYTADDAKTLELADAACGRCCARIGGNLHRWARAISQPYMICYCLKQ